MATLSPQGRIAAGLVLIAIVGVGFGGNYVLDLTRGTLPATDFQTTFARAGHGHAGSFATLGLVTILLTESTGYRGLAAHISRWSVPGAAVLMPAGFFLSSVGPGVTEPNGLIALVYVGAGVLVIGLITVAVGLLTAGRRKCPGMPGVDTAHKATVFGRLWGSRNI